MGICFNHAVGYSRVVGAVYDRALEFGHLTWRCRQTFRYAVEQ